MVFPAVLLVLIIGNVVAFRHYQDPKTFVFLATHFYHPLYVHPSGALSIRRSGHLADYYRLQEMMKGAHVVVSRGVEIDAWAWRHVALVALEFDGRERAIKADSRVLLHDRASAQASEAGRPIFFLADPGRLDGERVYLLSDPDEPGLLVVSEAELGRLGEHREQYGAARKGVDDEPGPDQSRADEAGGASAQGVLPADGAGNEWGE